MHAGVCCTLLRTNGVMCCACLTKHAVIAAGRQAGRYLMQRMDARARVRARVRVRLFHAEDGHKG